MALLTKHVLIWVLISNLLSKSTKSQSCGRAWFHEYCIIGSGSSYIDGDYSYAGYQNGCQYYRHNNNSYSLQSSAYTGEWSLWKGSVIRLRSCDESLLDLCVKGAWTSSTKLTYPSMTVTTLCTDASTTPSPTPFPTPSPTLSPTPSPISSSDGNPSLSTSTTTSGATSFDETLPSLPNVPGSSTYQTSSQTSSPADISSVSTATIVGIVAGAIVLAIIVGLIVCGFSRKGRQTPPKETNQTPAIEIAPGTTQREPTAIHKHSYEKISDQDEFEYKNVAPSAPDIALADDDAMNEVEGFLPTVEGDTDRYDHDDIRQWFNSSVNLQADNEKYLEIFINYGYDEMSLIQEIKESDLDTMGITKLAHKNRIMSAIKNINHQS
eukprot:4899_1